MDVEAGSIPNRATDFYRPSVEQMTAVEIVSKAISEEPTIPAKSFDLEHSGKNEDLSSNVKNSCDVRTSSAIVHQRVDPIDPPASMANAVAIVSAAPTPVTINKNTGKYRLLRTVGRGNFAKVKLALHMATGVEVAIKIINKTAMDSTLLERLKREITIMKVTNHPNIVRLLEIIENEDILCLVMEYASGGEIFDYLVAKGKMAEKDARTKFRQLLSAIQYCHSKRIVHRDLKAENILLDSNLNVKVADFGLANIFEYDQRLKTFCGSPPYAAPELFLGIPYYGPSVDIWSLGVILFTLVLGRLPFDAADLRELRTKIIGLNYSIPRDSLSPECEALLTKMLVLDPKDRSSLKPLMQDKWVNMGYASSEVLRPYKEPPRSQLDEVRVHAMAAMGFTRADLESSVVNPEFDHIYATYHLLPETPSQLMALYEGVILPPFKTPTPLTVTTASSQSHVRPSEVEQQTTAVGRFTVTPSTAIGEPQTKMEGQDSVQVSDTAHRHLGHGGSDAATREHHSLTATLPSALRKAFMQMGRTFAGTNTATAGQVAEVNSQTFTQTTSGRTSIKSAQKQNCRKHVTAAPVPIMSGKKSQIIAPSSKRLSPGPQAPLSVPITRSDSTDSTTAPSARAVAQGSPSSTVTSHGLPQVKPESVKKTPKQSPSTQSSKLPATQRSVVRASVPPPHVNVLPRSSKRVDNSAGVQKSMRSSVAETMTTDSKPASSSSTSSDSQTGTPVRTKSASSVQDVWLTVKQPNEAENMGLTPPSLESPPINHSTTTTEGSRSPYNTSQSQETQLLVGASTSDNEGQPSTTMALSKNSHTVQGSDAKALRGEVLRMQRETEGRPVNRISIDPSYALDVHQTNTWSRGVFKALGGFFTPVKPHDQRKMEPTAPPRTLSGPREVRFPWSVHTTSTKSPEEVLKIIVTALELTPGCRYAYDLHLPFLLRCSWAANRPALQPNTGMDTSVSVGLSTTMHIAHPTNLRGASQHCGQRDDPVHWEMEVCQLPRLHLRGVRLKRIRGSALQFRPIADLVMKSIHL